MDNTMDKPVNISNDKKNVLEFDIEITGVDESDMEVRFIIEGDGIELGFDSKKISKKTWSVEIPALKILETASYPYYISVIVDGYAFKGITGSVNILSASSVKASQPINTTIAPSTMKKTAGEKAVVKSTLKPKRALTGKPAPLSVKNSEEMLDNLLPKKVADVKKVDGLNSTILKTIEKAKEEVHKKFDDNKQDAKEKKETLDDNITRIINKAKEEVSKKLDDKKAAEEKKVAEDVGVETSTVVKVEPIIVEDIPNEVIFTEGTKKQGVFSAKEAAANLIKSVTGLGAKKAGSPKAVIKENLRQEKDKKVKEILTLKTEEKVEVPRQTTAGVKRVFRDGKIVEVDSSKEDKIKDALKKEDEDSENRKVTTTPLNKTVH